MLGTKKKTIGLFINRPEEDWQREIISELSKRLAEAGCNILIFTSNEIREVKDLYNFFSDIIAKVAPLERLDAVVVAFDTFDIPSFREALMREIRARAHCPIISLREKSKEFYSVLNGTNTTIASLVRHLHDVHGAERICFMAGYEGHHDSQEREKNYLASMDQLGLMLPAHAVYYGDMWMLEGENAFRYFFADPDNPPQAIVCANDLMARSLCEAVLSHGLRIPDDVIVTGVDNAYAATAFRPYLTTISDDVKGVAAETVRLILDLTSGVKREQYVHVPASILLRESCGCGKKHDSYDAMVVEQTKEHYRKIRHLSEQICFETFFRVDVSGSHSLEEIRTSACAHSDILGNVKDFWLVAMGEPDEKGLIEFGEALPDRATLLVGMRDGRRIPEQDVVFDRIDLLPKGTYSDEPAAYFVGLMHGRARCFGYTICRMKHYEDPVDRFYHSWNFTVGFSLQNYFAHRKIELLSEENAYNSITDFLTRLLNRRGLEEYIEALRQNGKIRERDLTLFSIDLDDLKGINDTYGHGEGDWAIAAIADCMRETMPAGTVMARTGGDEYIAVLQSEEADPDALTRELEACIARRNAGSGKPYTLSASVGACTGRADTPEAYEALIQQSDTRMYAVKRGRKNNP